MEGSTNTCTCDTFAPCPLHCDLPCPCGCERTCPRGVIKYHTWLLDTAIETKRRHEARKALYRMRNGKLTPEEKKERLRQYQKRYRAAHMQEHRDSNNRYKARKRAFVRAEDPDEEAETEEDVEELPLKPAKRDGGPRVPGYSGPGTTPL